MTESLLSPASRVRAVAIAGASVAGLVLAGDLLRRGFPGCVVVVSEPLCESRRLVAGSSLRGPALDRFTAAFGCSRAAAIEALGGPAAAFTRIATSPARARAGGRVIRFERPLLFRESREPVGLSTRHGRILRGLRALAFGAGVRVIDGSVREIGELLEAALPGGGVGALLVDARGGSPGVAPPASRYVLAAQAPLFERPRGPRPPLAPGLAYAPMIDLEDGRHLAFFTPFRDDFSPRATWYGIDTRIVTAAEAADAAGTRGVVSALERLANALGLELCDPEETLAVAAIPIDERFDEDRPIFRT
jgi:hypothetical protein